MTRVPRNDDDDDYYYDEPAYVGHVTVYEIDRPGPQFTGILDADGKPIYRVVPPKPPLGFLCDPSDLILFDLDPDVDFIYTTDKNF